MSESWEAAAAALVNDGFIDGAAEAPDSAVEPATAPPVADTPELTIDASGRAHGPDGKFAPKDSPEPEEASAEEEVPTDVGIEPEAESEVAESAPESDELIFELDDPDVLGYLDKYDGDVAKALKAATEAQSLIGRQGEELGNTRKENESLQEVVAQLKALEDRLQYQSVPYRNDSDDNPQGLIQEVLERASQTGHFDDATYEAAIQSWGLEDPFGAARFDAQVAVARQQAEAAVQEPPATGPDALAGEIEAFKGRHPDYQQMLPAIQELAAQRPLLGRSLYEGSAQERAQALQDLYDLAKSRTAASDTSTAVRKVILRAAAEAETAKADAAVVGASRSSAASSEPAEPTGDRLLEQALRKTGLGDDFVVVG